VHEGSNRRPGDLWGSYALDGSTGNHLLDLGYLGKVGNASENSLWSHKLGCLKLHAPIRHVFDAARDRVLTPAKDGECSDATSSRGEGPLSSSKIHRTAMAWESLGIRVDVGGRKVHGNRGFPLASGD
jgi:hypothetical protein